LLISQQGGIYYLAIPLLQKISHISGIVRFLSIKDFETFCFEKRYKIEHKFFYRSGKEIKKFPNLLAQTAIYFITKDKSL
jgi:hypothetical protein